MAVQDQQPSFPVRTTADDQGKTADDQGDKDRQEWLRAAYAEAWQQYCHEDTLSLQRNNVFVLVRTDPKYRP